MKTHNKGETYEINREYRSQMDLVLNNLKDELNFQLKRKIINRTFQPIQIATAAEIDLCTTAKREEILEKQKRYIAEFTVEKSYQPEEERPVQPIETTVVEKKNEGSQREL